MKELLVAHILEGAPLTDELVRAIATTPELQAECVRLAAVVHELGAPHAADRLDALLDVVALAPELAAQLALQPHTQN